MGDSSFMMGVFVTKYLLFGASALAFAMPAAAQDDAWTPLNEAQAVDETSITITVTGTRIELDDTGQAVTVIGDEEIQSVQGPELVRVLERVPGLAFSRNGGLGGFTGVRLRGAEAEQVLTVLDGVRVADPASPSGGFDFGNLLSYNLGKVEVLRGSNSTVWGSDAIGGVIVASTRAASGIEASAEYGANDSFSAAASGGLSDDDLGFVGLAASYAATDGFSAAEIGTEPDGFEQFALDAHGRAYLSPTFEIFARGRYAEGELDIDGFPAPAFSLADTLETQETRQVFASAGAVYDTPGLFVQASYAFSDTARDNFDPAFGSDPSFTSDGRSERVEARGEWRPIGPLLVNFGADYEWLSYETLFDTGASTDIGGAYVQLGVERGPLAAHVGGRYTDHEDFGSDTSFGADASYRIAQNLRLRASIGEGFKAPSLFQLLSDFGNATLQPEESTSYDLGLAYGERDERVFAAVTAFRRVTSNQIAFVGCFGVESDICVNRPFGTYDNIARTRAQGIEVEGRYMVADGFSLGGVYAFVDAEDRDTGNRLARRPKHAATLIAEVNPLAALTLGADLRMVSSSFDDAGNFTKLDGYETLTLRAAYDVTDMVQLYGRVENVWDEDYQTAAGYATRGRAAFIGARLSL